MNSSSIKTSGREDSGQAPSIFSQPAEPAPADAADEPEEEPKVDPKDDPYGDIARIF